MRLQIEANKDGRGRRNKSEPWRATAVGEYGAEEHLFTIPAESKREAANHAIGILLGHWVDRFAPEALNFRGTICILSRDTSGWGYRMFDLDKMGFREWAGHCSCGFTSFDECQRAAVWHLATNKRETGEITSALLSVLPQDARTCEMDERFAAHARVQDEFRARYRDAIGRGMSENDAHDYAGHNPARRELWETAA